MKKIVVAGISVYGLNNLSDDAMFKVFIDELHKNCSDLKITLLARHPSKELDEAYNLKSIHNLDHQSREESRGRYFNGLNSNDSNEHLVKIMQALKESDLLVIGGDPFIDVSIGVYKGLIPYTSLLITLAKFLGKPIMLNAIHFGRKLNTEMGKELAKFCISNVDLVTIREEESRPFIESMGIKTDHIVALSDTSYGLDVRDNGDRANEIFRKENFKFQKKNLIGVTFRHMYWKWKQNHWDELSSKVAEICDFMIEKFDADIVLIPHNTYEIDDKYMNDIPSHTDICNKVKNKNNIHNIKSRYSVSDTLSIFKHLDLVFSNRRHSLIFGALSGVAGLGVGEKLHVKVTVEELGIGGELFVDIENFDENLVMKNLEKVWKTRKEVIEKEQKVLPELIIKAKQHAKLALELIK